MERSKHNKQESYWENYDLLIWKKDPGGFTNVKGMFRKDQWGICLLYTSDAADE